MYGAAGRQTTKTHHDSMTSKRMKWGDAEDRWQAGTERLQGKNEIKYKSEKEKKRYISKTSSNKWNKIKFQTTGS